MWRLTSIALVAFVVLSCGGDIVTDPDRTGSVTFPTMDPAVLAAVCIMGQAVPPQTVSGTVTDDDCHTGIANDGYFEGWRVRVAAQASVTFAVTSSFDSWLELYEIRNLSDPANSAVLLNEDDDSNGNLDARITWTLQPNTEYVIFISGYDDAARGSYSLSIN